MKHCRLAFKQLKDEFPELQIMRLRQKKHLVYELRLGDVVRHLAVSVSPKNYDHATIRVVKEAKQLLGITK